MRLAIVLIAVVLTTAAPASAQTISVSGAGSLTTITTSDLEVRAVLEAASFALNVPQDFEGLTLGEGCRFTGVPAFNPIGANFRYGCLAGPNFQSRWGRATTSSSSATRARTNPSTWRRASARARTC